MTALADLLAVTADGRPLHLRRAWPRGDDHMLLDYQAAGGGAAAQWFADAQRLRHVARETVRAAAHPDDVTVVPALGLLVQRNGADRRLPAVADVLARADAALVVHRPERRAVVRIGTGEQATWAKLVRPERAGALAAGGSADLGVRTPRLLGCDRAAGTTRWATLAGRPLHDVLDRPDGEAAAAAAGAATAALHRAGLAGLPVHGPSDEAALVATTAARLSRWAPGIAAAVLAQSDAVARALAADPGPAAVVHRDLHDRQVFVDGTDVGVLDLDTLAEGEPALDLANLLVHLELRVLQGVISPARSELLAAAVVDAYRPSPAVRRRLPAYALSSRLRLACVYAVRPQSPGVSAQLLDAAGDPLPGVSAAVASSR